MGDGGGKNKIRAAVFIIYLYCLRAAEVGRYFVYGEKTHESELRIKLAAHFRTNLQYLHPPNVLREKLLPTSKNFAEMCEMFRTGKFEFS